MKQVLQIPAATRRPTMSAPNLLRVTRIAHRFGLPMSQAALIAGLFWTEGRA